MDEGKELGTKDELSNCCSAPVIVEGNSGIGSTRFFRCNSCKEPCDLLTEEEKNG